MLMSSMILIDIELYLVLDLKYKKKIQKIEFLKK